MLVRKDEIEEFRKQNRKDRLWFVEYWAEYVRTHPDEDWSRQQNRLINAVYEGVRKNKHLSCSSAGALRDSGEQTKEDKKSTKI